MKRLAFFLLLVPALVWAQDKQILPAKEFKTKLSDKNVILLDVRTPAEFKEAHLDKAVNKNVFDQDFDSYCTKLDKGKTYMVYCKGGKRSHDAAETMRKKGLIVVELEGGILRWNEEKLPVVK